jgi:hypothetical protein
VYLKDSCECAGVVGITAKLRADGAISGFCSYNVDDVDLFLCSYFCRPGITESLGMLVREERWLHVAISNRTEKD